MSNEAFVTTPPRKSFVIALVVVVSLVLGSLLATALVMSLRPQFSASYGARMELTERLEKVFAQRYGVPQESVMVNLGAGDADDQLGGEPAPNVTVLVTANSTEASAFLSELTETPKSWLTVSGGFARLGAGFDVPLAGEVRAGITQTLSDHEGKLNLTPEGFYLGELRVTAEQLLEVPLVGDSMGEFTKRKSYCLSERTPRGFELKDARITGSKLELTFSGKDVSLELEKLQESGSCG